MVQPKVIIVHLRRPRFNDANEMRTDPFWEFGSFGCTRCHQRNMLIFYCGLEGWDYKAESALYLMGYFDVQVADKVSEFSSDEINSLFGENFHVRHQSIYEKQKADLILVKGSEKSRLLKKAVLMSDVGQDRAGRPLKVLSSEMQKIFGNFDGRISFQRSPTRWVAPAYVEKAAQFMKSLE